jgi:hypothetical protein
MLSTVASLGRIVKTNWKCPPAVPKPDGNVEMADDSKTTPARFAEFGSTLYSLLGLTYSPSSGWPATPLIRSPRRLAAAR